MLYSVRDGRKVLVKPVLAILRTAGSGSQSQEKFAMTKEPTEATSPANLSAIDEHSDTPTGKIPGEQVPETPSPGEGQQSLDDSQG